MTYRALLLMTSLLAFCLPAHAAPGDADKADSLNFEDFHTEQEGAITLWDSDKGEFGVTEKTTTVTYDDDAGDTAAPTATGSASTATPPRASPAPQAIATEKPGSNVAKAEAYEAKKTQEQLSRGKGYDGQRFMIRARYAPGNSANAQTASAAINNLHQQMAGHCPNGWLKIREWSLPVGPDYYLHYLFQCASPARE
ncbi:MAG TPA: hypothetical protein VIM96_05900 [Pseudomonadales bacterium]